MVDTHSHPSTWRRWYIIPQYSIGNRLYTIGLIHFACIEVAFPQGLNLSLRRHLLSEQSSGATQLKCKENGSN